MSEYLITFLISMVPIIELRGALVYAITAGIPTVPAYIICVIGNMLPVPIIYFFARKVLIWGKDKQYIGKFFTFCYEKGERGGQKMVAKTGRRGLFLGLLLFVGIGAMIDNANRKKTADKPTDDTPKDENTEK